MLGNITKNENADVLKPLVEDETSAMELSALSPFSRTSLDQLVDNNNNDKNPVTTLRIKSSYGDTEVDIQGCPKTTIVSKLKSLVKQALSQKDQETNNQKSNNGFQDRQLRLICKGKLLSPDDSKLDEFKVTNGDVIHAVLGKPGSGQSATATTAIPRRGQRQREHTNNIQHVLFQHQRRRRQRNSNRGMIVGPGGRVTRAPEAGDDSDHDDEEMGGERLGFDRLRSAGLSRQEVTAVRIYFNRHVDRFVQQQQQQQQSDSSSGLHLDEPDLSRRRLLVEDEWMQTQGPTSEFRLNLNQNTLMRYASQDVGRIRRPGNDREFMWGFCLGFFVGVLGLVWVWMPSISHKQKLGILTGICFQLMLEGGSEQNFDQETSMFVEGSDGQGPLEWN